MTKQTKVKHFVLFIQTYKNIIFSHIYVINKRKGFNIFFMKNIFALCIKTKITFYTFQNNMSKENHFFL